MTITRDQLSSLAATSAAGSLNVTWPVNPAAGATVLVAVSNVYGAPVSVADNGTTPSTFTQDAGNNAGTYNVWIYRANSITLPSSGSYTVTVNVSPSQMVTAAGISYLESENRCPGCGQCPVRERQRSR